MRSQPGICQKWWGFRFEVYDRFIHIERRGVCCGVGPSALPKTLSTSGWSSVIILQLKGVGGYRYGRPGEVTGM